MQKPARLTVTYATRVSCVASYLKKPTKLSHWAHSILFGQLMNTLVHYTYTVPLPGLVDHSAFLERVLPTLYKFTTETMGLTITTRGALNGRHGSEIHLSDRETSLTPFKHVLAYDWDLWDS